MQHSATIFPYLYYGVFILFRATEIRRSWVAEHPARFTLHTVGAVRGILPGAADLTALFGAQSVFPRCVFPRHRRIILTELMIVAEIKDPVGAGCLFAASIGPLPTFEFSCALLCRSSRAGLCYSLVGPGAQRKRFFLYAVPHPIEPSKLTTGFLSSEDCVQRAISGSSCSSM